jgi:biotin operon repressor
MGHTITFDKFDGFILSEEEVRDLVEMFYRWGDTRFVFTTDENERAFRGECFSNWAGHTITLVRKNIVKAFENGKHCGGNLPAPTLKVAAASVVVHELQHANQYKLNSGQNKFYGKLGGLRKDGKPRMQHYKNRACERDARNFADERMGEICAYFAVPFQKGPAGTNGSGQGAEVLNVAALLLDCEEVSMDDVRDELRASKALTPTNVRAVIEELKKNGLEISSRKNL